MVTPKQTIVCKPGIHGGKPCVSGTRITVETIQTWSKARTAIELLKAWPTLTPDGIAAALAYKLTKRKPRAPSVKAAIDVIGKGIKKDVGNYIGWQSNIAMAFVDCERWYRERHGIKRCTRRDLHAVANEAAQYFIKQLFGVTPPKDLPENLRMKEAR